KANPLRDWIVERRRATAARNQQSARNVGWALLVNAPPALRRLLVRLQRRAECFEQFSVDGVALRVVLGVPLHTECKTRGVRDPDRLDGAVFGDTFDHHACAGFEDALAVQ